LTKRSSDALNRFELMFVCDVVELGAQFWSCVAQRRQLGTFVRGAARQQRVCRERHALERARLVAPLIHRQHDVCVLAFAEHSNVSESRRQLARRRRGATVALCNLLGMHSLYKPFFQFEIYVFMYVFLFAFLLFLLNLFVSLTRNFP
jgi:hypothetical protein